MLSILFAILATFTQAPNAPATFMTHASGHASVSVSTAHFIGRTWLCNGETCYAGLRDGALVTGP